MISKSSQTIEKGLTDPVIWGDPKPQMWAFPEWVQPSWSRWFFHHWFIKIMVLWRNHPGNHLEDHWMAQRGSYFWTNITNKILVQHSPSSTFRMHWRKTTSNHGGKPRSRGTEKIFTTAVQPTSVEEAGWWDLHLDRLAQGDTAVFGGVQKWRYPNSWMVRENPTKIWMIAMGYPYFRKPPFDHSKLSHIPLGLLMKLFVHWDVGGQEVCRGANALSAAYQHSHEAITRSRML